MHLNAFQKPPLIGIYFASKQTLHKDFGSNIIPWI